MAAARTAWEGSQSALATRDKRPEALNFPQRPRAAERAGQAHPQPCHSALLPAPHLGHRTPDPSPSPSPACFNYVTDFL